MSFSSPIDKSELVEGNKYYWMDSELGNFQVEIIKLNKSNITFKRLKDGREETISYTESLKRLKAV